MWFLCFIRLSPYLKGMDLPGLKPHQSKLVQSLSSVFEVVVAPNVPSGYNGGQCKALPQIPQQSGTFITTKGLNQLGGCKP